MTSQTLETPVAANALARPAQQEPDASQGLQRVQVGHELDGRSRLDVFAQICGGRRVLHVGCTGPAAADSKASLHLALQAHCVQLDGVDDDAAALAELAPQVTGRLFSRLEDVTGDYDLILVPQLLSRMPNAATFLARLHALDAPHFVLTVPDAYQCHFDYVERTQAFAEAANPDDVCWYTPFTLSNVIAKSTPWLIDGLWFLDGLSLLAMATKPRSN